MDYRFRDRLSRRRVVQVFGSGAIVGLAGCLGGISTDDTGDTDDDETTPAFRDHPGDEPREFEDWFCDGVCGMSVSAHPQYNAQLAHDDGTGAFFCTSGCLLGYYVLPDHHDAPSAITNIWVTDYETGDLIDGRSAYYVLIRDADLVSDPMGINPRPFAEQSAALAYLDDHDDDSITENDIVQLTDIDTETIAIYRGNRLPIDSKTDS